VLRRIDGFATPSAKRALKSDRVVATIAQPKQPPDAMPDIVIKDVEAPLFERISTAASERGCAIEEITVRALRFAFGLSADDLAPRDRQDIATLRGIWNQGENQAFREAIEAFHQVDSGPQFEARSANK
jgi:hypothetical protein